jgi:drug/metabolite transporter (DMT)-like permease
MVRGPVDDGHERFSPGQAVGAVLILGAVLLLARSTA